MPKTTKSRPAGASPAINPRQTLMLHDVTNRRPPANAAARRPKVAPPAAANHARHHVSRAAQS